MPRCPIAMPSSTPMVLNSNGTPPASRTPSLTTLPKDCKWTWPGIRSMYELHTPMNGRSKSDSRLMAPVARSRLRCGALVKPRVTVSLRRAGTSAWGRGSIGRRRLWSTSFADATGRPARQVRTRTRSTTRTAAKVGISVPDDSGQRVERGGHARACERLKDG